MVNKEKTASFSVIGLLLFSIIIPVNAEVSTFTTNSKQYDAINDEIIFSGLVDDNSDLLVSIVIHDTEDKFVMLTQALILPDFTYEKKIIINEKFSIDGMYNATAFITQLSSGKTINFTYSYDGIFEVPIISEPVIDEATIIEIIDEPTIEETIEEIIIDEESINKTPDFVDQDVDPIHYVNRYYNEPSYKEWFDKNYPNFTIEEAVGYVPEEIILKEDKVENEIEIIAPIASAALMSPNVIPNDNFEANELALMALAMGGIGILLGAIYGVRNKFDNKINTKSKNSMFRKKIFPIIGRVDPITIIQDRLAKGEITVSEYHSLQKALLNK